MSSRLLDESLDAVDVLRDCGRWMPLNVRDIVYHRVIETPLDDTNILTTKYLHCGFQA